jgi:hypothetical protein
MEHWRNAARRKRREFQRAQKTGGVVVDAPGACSFYSGLCLTRLGELISSDGGVGNVWLGQAIVVRQATVLNAVQKDHLGRDDLGALALLAGVRIFPAVGLQPAGHVDPAAFVEVVLFPIIVTPRFPDIVTRQPLKV